MLNSAEELLQKIHLGEDTFLELKAVALKGNKVAAPRRSDLADEIAAIANTSEGMLVLGVDDDRQVSGIPLDKLDGVERFIFEICSSSIRPPVHFRSQRLELPDPSGTLQPVLKVEIPRSLFVHQSPGGYFYRQGSAKQPLPPDVLARLFQHRSQARLIRFDEQTVPETSIGDLRPHLYHRFLKDSAEDESLVLRKLRLLKIDDMGVERATVSGVLLCTESPEHWLPGAFIQAVCYSGERRNADDQFDTQEITGPLDEQILRAVAFVKRNMRTAAIKDPARRDLPQYSVNAVFEAIVNAVAHRDYSIHGSKIRLFMFSDRIELYSPGALPNTLTVDSLSLRQYTRNELITSLLAKGVFKDPTNGTPGLRSLMEKRGEGVPIILKEGEQVAGRAPEYRVIDNAEVLLTLWAADLEKAKAAARSS